MLSSGYLKKMDAYWRAANYLSVAQLYLMDNPLLREPLKPADIKKKIVGHWGTIPGQNFIYTHLNRAIKKYDLDMMLVVGPGHGGNAFVSNAYLEGTYSEIYPTVSEDQKGMKKLCKQFSFPGGVSSHVAPETPGSIHEGGELGYSLAHAFGAVFDNPNLIATCIVGDGEAETGTLATSWHSNKFLNPIIDGAVLPILHLNGYKINNPTVLARITREELENLLIGYGWKPYFVSGDEPMLLHRQMAITMDKVVEEIKQIQRSARENGDSSRPIWPMIVLNTPKGWTGPKKINGEKIEDSHRAHQIPITMSKPEDIVALRDWLLSYKPNELFTKDYKLKPELKALCPTGDARISANPHTNGGSLLRELRVPDFADYAVDVPSHGTVTAQDTLELGKFIRDIIALNPDNYRLFSPDEVKSNRLYHTFDSSAKNFNASILKTDDNLAPDGRIMDAFLSENMCEGWLEGYLLTGRHGTFASYESFIRVVDSMVSQHAKWLKVCNELPWRKDIASLNILLTSNVWQQDHNGYTHQDPGFLDHIANKKADVVRMYLPPDTNCLLSCYDHCIRSKNYVNAIVASKHPTYQWLSMPEAIKHCTAGVSVWDWASNCESKPDIVMACCGDTATIEALAATTILNSYLPNLKVRFINVVDLMKLGTDSSHSHGLTDKEYNDLFTTNKPIFFVYHGYPTLIHELTWSRKNRDINVFGYMEEGTITTAFDVRVQNKIDRFNIVKSVLAKLNKTDDEYVTLNKKMDELLSKHNEYVRKFGQDIPEVRNWKWTAPKSSKKPSSPKPSKTIKAVKAKASSTKSSKTTSTKKAPTKKESAKASVTSKKK